MSAFSVNCCCCDGPDVILMWNSNAITDDDFDVTLNGTLLANRDGNTAPLCKATIFSKDQLINSTWSDFPATGICCCCSPITIETFGLDTTLFVEGTNTIHLTQTANNDSGNCGILAVVRLQLQDDNTYKSCKTWLNTTYTGAGDYTFTWSATV